MTIATKERQIIFSGEMVRAILDGRKTRTRRVVKPQPKLVDEKPNYLPNEWGFWSGGYPDHGRVVRCPYGAPGDRLWVRETWACIWTEHEPGEGQTSWDVPHRIEYKADSGVKYPGEWPDDCGDDPECPRWSSPIHMPRRASRILLEVVSVRVERVQEISETDAIAEGMTMIGPPALSNRTSFSMLWDSINVKRGFGWDVNPWVWVVKFKRVEASERSEANDD